MSQNPFDALLEEGRQLREGMLGLMGGLSGRAKDFDLPAPDEAWGVAQARLSDDVYQLLVVGEVKRGKSTLINALTGLRLPENVDVATSQVFRIHHAEVAAYRVCYEDGAEKPIEASDLEKYGSQVVIDEEGNVDLGKTIRWIDVAIPYPPYLPKNIVLFDTPGVGGLNASHEEITHRFVPRADAVVFVLDSTHPVNELETRFLGDILAHCRHVFFVQTKIDEFEQSQWQAVRTKSETTIRKRFGSNIPDVTVWPLSSVLLQQAAAAKEHAELRLIDSRHREFSRALRAFLYKVIGWSRAADATVLAVDFYTKGGTILAERYAALVDETRQKANEYRDRAEGAKRAIDDTNSDFNRLRARSLDRLRDGGRKAIHRMEDRLYEIEHNVRERINELGSLDAARAFSEEMVDLVNRQCAEALRNSRREALEIYSEALTEMTVVAERDLRFEDVEAVELARKAFTFETSGMDRASTLRNHTLSAAFVSAPVIGILVAVGILAAPAAAAAAAAAAVVGIFTGVKAVGRNEAGAAKTKLRQHLDASLPPVRRSQMRAVEDQYRHLDREFCEGLERLAAKRRREAEAELATLREQAAMSQRQRAEEAAKTKARLEEWKTFGERLKATDLQLGRLHQRLTPAVPRPDEVPA